MTYNAKIIADSRYSKLDFRVTTFEITMPKWLVAEFNTHRMLSRNSASSRAIPTHKIISQVLNHPVIPLDFRAKNKGMTAVEDTLTIEQQEKLRYLWRKCSTVVVSYVQRMMDVGPGVDKQRINRLMEPWMWTTIVATATEWDNYFKLRVSEQAQPELHYVSAMMLNAYVDSTPDELTVYDWHLPYISIEEILSGEYTNFELAMRSAARCGRVSYINQDKTHFTLEEDIARAETFVQDHHMSPLEHPCMVTPARVFYGNLFGFKALRKFVKNESNSLTHGNFVDYLTEFRNGQYPSSTTSRA